ncbi:MAG: translocation/assembly module TamB domain-containing protein [Betaproteobacteria bacterium]|nr:translocation/assembly module TamB domain-containing protein [Betaproteobacteria bacterium]
MLSLGIAAVLAPWLLLAWLIGTPEGFKATAHLLRIFSGERIVLNGVSGRLLDTFGVERLHVAAGGIKIEATGLALDWEPAELFVGSVHAQRLSARTLAVTLQSQPGPAHTPESFALPLAVQLDELQIGRFDLLSQESGQTPKRIFGLRETAARALLERTDWRIDTLKAQTDWGHAELQGRLAPLAPFALDASGRFRARYGENDLDLKIRADGSLVAMQLAAQGSAAGLETEAQLKLHAFAAMPIGELELKAGVLDPRRFHPDAPRAALSIHAQLAPDAQPAGAPESAGHAPLRVTGPVEIRNAEPGRLDAGRLPVERVSGQLSLSDGFLRFTQMQWTIRGGGSIQGDLAWTMPSQGSGNPVGEVEGELRLAALDPSALYADLPRARLSGQIQAQVQGHKQRVVARLSDARLQLALDASHEGGRVEIASLGVNAGAMHAQGSGHFDLTAPRGFSAEISAERFDPHFFWAAAPAGQISGELSGSGRLLPQLDVDAQIKLGDSRFAGLPLTGKGSVSLSGTRLAKIDLALEALGNKLTASGALGARGDRLDFRLTANELDRIGHGFSGRLRARGSLGGTYREPVGELEVLADRLAMPNGYRLDALNFRARLFEGAQGLVDARVAVAGVRMAGSVEQTIRRASLVVTGVRGEHTISLDADLLRGRSVSLGAQGALSDKLDWSGMLTRLNIVWQQELVLAEPTMLAFGLDHLNLGAARLKGDTADIRLETTDWHPGSLIAKGHMTGLKLGLALNEDRQVVAHGETLTLGAEWNIKLDTKVNGVVRVFRERGDIILAGDAPVALGLSELEAVLAATDDRLAFSFAAAGKTIGAISASATALAEFNGSHWELAREQALLGRARIDMPTLDWLGPIVDQNLRTQGVVRGDFSLSGTPDDLVTSGAINGDDLSLLMLDQGLRLEGGRLRVRFERNTLFLDEFAFVSPSRVRPDERRIDYAKLTREPGTAALSGQIDLSTLAGNFKLVADRLPILQLPDRWIMVSGSGEMETDGMQASIRGKVNLPAGFIGFAPAGAPRLDSDVVVRGREAPPAQAFRTRVDVEVDLGHVLYLRAMGVDTRLAGQLALQARPGEPLRVSGQVVTRDGRYEIHGQELAIEQGLITFQGPADNPTLSITAIRRGLPVEAGVQITGSAQRPRIRLVSNPNVPDAEKLSWMILGRGPGGANSQADVGLLIAAASVLTGGATGGLANQIANTFGVDQITIAQGESRGLGVATTSQVAGSATGFSSSSASASSDTVNGQVVRLVKRLSNTLNLSFEQSLAGTGSLVRLTYALTRRLSLVGQAGTDNALDLTYSISFY